MSDITFTLGTLCRNLSLTLYIYTYISVRIRTLGTQLEHQMQRSEHGWTIGSWQMGNCGTSRPLPPVEEEAGAEQKHNQRDQQHFAL